MSRWIPICRVEDLPLLGARRVAREQGMPVALFRSASNRVYALLDRCPHKAGPLSQGIVHGEHVACPLHNWNIGLADGRAAAPDEGSTPAFAVKLQGEQVFLDADELATKALDLQPAVAGPCQRTHACS
jgi:nitrite reductase (NADH) small subunit